MTQTDNKVTIVVTGLTWMGHGIRSIDSTIEEMLNSASDEIQIAAYMITKGAEDFLRLINQCLNRGVRVTLIVNRFRNQPRSIQMVIAQMMSQYRHFNLLEFCPKDVKEDLHAKLIVVDRSIALIGSSNLSWKGLILNHELAVVVEGPTAARIGGLIDTLVNNSKTRPVKF